MTYLFYNHYLFFQVFKYQSNYKYYYNYLLNIISIFFVFKNQFKQFLNNYYVKVVFMLKFTISLIIIYKIELIADKDQNNTDVFTIFRINLYQVIYAIILIY